MGKSTFFMKSTVEPYPNSKCHKCDLVIAEVQQGEMYWNPNPNAHDKNICQNCYDVWNNQRVEGYKKWRKKHEELINPEIKERTIINKISQELELLTDKQLNDLFKDLLLLNHSKEIE
jgi:hypothetical protein